MTWKRKKSHKTGRSGWQRRFVDPVTGLRKKKTFWYSEIPDAERAYMKFLEERERVRDGLPSNAGLRLAYEELVKKFVQDAPITSDDRRNDLRRMLERNPLRLTAVAELFDKSRLTSACRELANGKFRCCCWRSVQAPLKQMTAWAASVDVIPYDPLGAWKKLPWRKTRKRTRAFSVEEMRELLCAVAECDEIYRRKHSLALPVLTLLLSGNRPNAVVAAKVEDLAEDKIRLAPGNGKKRNGASMLPPEFVNVLNGHLKTRGKARNDAPLLVSADGGAIDRKNLLEDFRRAAVLAFVHLSWPGDAKYAEVEPASVAHLIYTGRLRGYDGPPPKAVAKINARKDKERLVEEVAQKIQAAVESKLSGASPYSLRKTHITWARQLLGKQSDAVRVQVGHAALEVEDEFYVEDSLVHPSKSSEAVWSVLLGRSDMHGTEQGQCFEVAWRDERLMLERVERSGPVVAPDDENEAKNTARTNKTFTQGLAIATFRKISPAGLEPTTSGLGNQRSIHLSYGDTYFVVYKLARWRFWDGGFIFARPVCVGTTAKIVDLFR